MSGIYISGIKMPNRCLDCPFMVSRENDDCILQSDEANASFYEWDDMKKNCPLIPVPEHGRLIDADALYMVMTKERNRIAETYGENDEYVQCLRKYAMSMVANAPTIIPAEPPKEEQI